MVERTMPTWLIELLLAVLCGWFGLGCDDGGTPPAASPATWRGEQTELHEAYLRAQPCWKQVTGISGAKPQDIKLRLETPIGIVNGYPVINYPYASDDKIAYYEFSIQTIVCANPRNEIELEMIRNTLTHEWIHVLQYNYGYPLDHNCTFNCVPYWCFPDKTGFVSSIFPCTYATTN